MRYFFILLACLLTGCLKTTSELIGETSASWAGQKANIFFDRYGQPKSVEKQQPNLVTYNWVGTGDSAKIYGNGYGHGLSLYCVLEIDVSDGLIESIRMARTEGQWNWPRCAEILNGGLYPYNQKPVSEHGAAW